MFGFGLGGGGLGGGIASAAARSQGEAQIVAATSVFSWFSTFRSKIKNIAGTAGPPASEAVGRPAGLPFGAARFALNGKNGRGATVNFHRFAVCADRRQCGTLFRLRKNARLKPRRRSGRHRGGRHQLLNTSTPLGGKLNAPRESWGLVFKPPKLMEVCRSRLFHHGGDIAAF